MDVDLIFKIAAVGILVAVLNILLTRSGREDQALMTSITGLVVVLVIVVQEISELFDLIRDLFIDRCHDRTVDNDLHALCLPYTNSV